MKLKGIEFDFNPLNAAHLERMAEAAAIYQARSEEVKAQDRPTLEGRIQTIRASCRNIADYIDTVLGEGASKKLGMDQDDIGYCLDVLEEFTRSVLADSGNRTQRRAAAKKSGKKK